MSADIKRENKISHNIKPISKRRRLRLSLTGKRAVTGLLFVLPFLIGFFTIIVYGIVTSIRMSLSDVVATGAGVGAEFVWNNFENYIIAFRVHPTFTEVMTSSLLDMLIDVPLIIFFSLFMALFLNQKFKGRVFVRAIFFLPVILAAPAIADSLNMARAMMIGGISPASPEVIDAINAGSGVNMQYYLDMLGDIAIPPTLLNYIIGAVSRINTIIMSSGVQIVIFLAALQSISPSVYEAAKIEGATPYETFWLITFPMVSPMILTNVVYTIVDSFISSPVVNLSYNTIFTEYNFGLGSVFSIISSLAVCLVIGIMALVLGRKTFYHT